MNRTTVFRASHAAASLLTAAGLGVFASPVGSILSVTPPPAVASLSAVDGFAGDTVTITGTNLDGASLVKFGSVTATVTADSATSLDATVPGDPFSAGKVSVTTPGGTATSKQAFAITKATKLSPTSAIAGKILTITGQGLGSATTVRFFAGYTGIAVPTYDDVPVSGTPTATLLKVVVPPDAQRFELTVVTPHGSVDTPGEFTPLPSVTALAPADGVVGESVQIHGSNLLPTTSVTFGGIAATVTGATATEIDTTVPGGFTAGKVAVTTPDGSAAAKQPFAVPQATSISPKAGPAGTLLTIHGTGLAAITTVAFPTISSTVSTPLVGNATNTSVRVRVPAAATTGPLVLSDDAGHSISTSMAFGPVPKIAGLSPSDGLDPIGGVFDGTAVQIVGTNLSDATAVMFGDVPAVLDSVTATEVDTTVPAGFTGGAKVSVTTPAGVITSPQPFTVTTVTGISPAAASPGSTVTITGQGLGSVTLVGFYTDPGLYTCFPACVDAVAPGKVTPTSVQVRVPADAVAGPLLVLSPSTVTVALLGYPVETGMFTPRPAVTTLSATDGVPGNVVAIDGAGFGDGVTGVAFGSVAASSFTVVSAGEVDATVPGGFASATVTVTTPDGSATSKQVFAITHVNALSPASAAGGAVLTISGTGLADAKTVDFAGDTGQPVTAATATSVKVVVPDDAETGTLTVHSSYTTPAPTSWSVTSSATFTPKPAISSLSATDGVAGMTVTIDGAGLAGATAVAFGAVPGTITSVSPTSVAATVPGDPFVSGRVTVTTPSGTVTSKQTFTITKVAKVAPLSAAAGATVTLSGQGLASTSYVLFQASSAAQCYSAPDEDCFQWVAPSSKSATTVKAAVPPNAINGRVYLFNANVGENAASLIGTGAFFEPLPAITGFAPDPSQAGDTVTLTGSNLNAGGVPTVTVGADGVTASGASATSLTFVVPDDAVTTTVTVTNGNGSATSRAPLHVRPTIATLSVDHGAAGDTVVLGGRTFTGTKTVTFGDDTQSAQFTVSPDGTSLTTTVPATAVSGAISVTNAGGTTTTDPFLVDPVIASISPGSAEVGDTVTVTGTGLADADSVSFSGDLSPAVPTSTSPTSLEVVVPGRAQPGPIRVHTAAGGSAVSAGSLNVTYSVFGIDPAAAVYDHTVALVGVGLTSGVTAVTFNGVPASTFTVVSDSEIDATTPDSGDITGPVMVSRGARTTYAGDFTLMTLASFSPASGSVGDTVTLHGTGLGDLTGVSFGGVDATVSDYDSTTVTVTVPDGATAGPIALTAPGGTITTSDSFQVVASGLEIVQVDSDRIQVKIAHGGALPDESLTVEGDGGADIGISLPGITVASGDVIVFHGGDGATTETSSKTECTDPACFGSAWDVATALGSLPPGPVIITAPFDTVVLTDKTKSWDSGLLTALANVQGAGGWTSCAGACDSAGADAIAVDWSALSTGQSAQRTAGDSNSAADWSLGSADFG